MKKLFFTLFILISISVSAQNISWTDISGSHNLPEGITLYSGVDYGFPLRVKCIDIDLNNPNISVRSYLYDGSFQNVKNFCSSVGAVAAINGGFFGGGQPYSAVVEPDGVGAKNIAGVTRDGVYYPVTRGFFGINNDRSMSVDWVYHFGNNKSDIYKYNAPASNSVGYPAATPSASNGTPLSNLNTGVGGGPVLVKNGSQYITYTAEVIWGSGVSYSTRDPRTAVGYTADNHVIMVVADGRQSGYSIGVTLPELAQIMIDLGCVEALNLDGGGSSQMAVGSQYVSSPSEYRAVSSILAVNYEEPLIEAPTLLNPADNAEGTSSPVNFTWEMAETQNADFRIQVSTSADGWTPQNGFTTASGASETVPVNNGTGQDTQYNWSEASYGNPYCGPQYGTTYYWTVRAYRPDLGVSTYSQPRSFTVEVPTPDLLTPAADAQDVDSPVDFSWSSPFDNASFRIQVATSTNGWTAENGFTSETSASESIPVNIGTGDTNFSWADASNGNPYTAPQANTTYYWTVRSYRADVGVSMYSSPQSFTTWTIPSSVTISCVSETTVGESVTFSGTATEDVSHVKVTVDGWEISDEPLVDGQYSFDYTFNGTGTNREVVASAYNANEEVVATDTKYITVTQATNSVTITPPETVIVGESAYFEGTGTGNVSYVIVTVDGWEIANETISNGEYSFSYTFNGAGTNREVVATGYNSSGTALVSDTKYIDVLTHFVNLDAPSQVYVGESANFSGTASSQVEYVIVKADGWQIANETIINGAFSFSYPFNTAGNNREITASGYSGSTLLATDTEYMDVVNNPGARQKGTCATGISDISYQVDFSLYPNPAHNKATLCLSLQKENELQIVIYDIQGRKLNEDKLKAAAGEFVHTLDISHYQEGIYLVKVSGTGFIQTRRLVVRR